MKVKKKTENLSGWEISREGLPNTDSTTGERLAFRLPRYLSRAGKKRKE